MNIQGELKLRGWIWYNVSGTWFAKNLVGEQIKAGTFRSLINRLSYEESL